jgi:hypothetical protein
VIPQLSPTGLIDAPSAGHFAQPVDAVLPRFNLIPVPVKFQEDFLSQFLRYRMVLQKMVCHAEDHRLMLADSRLKRATAIRFRNGSGNANLLDQAADHDPSQ